MQQKVSQFWLIKCPKVEPRKGKPKPEELISHDKRSHAMWVQVRQISPRLKVNSRTLATLEGKGCVQNIGLLVETKDLT